MVQAHQQGTPVAGTPVPDQEFNRRLAMREAGILVWCELPRARQDQ